MDRLRLLVVVVVAVVAFVGGGCAHTVRIEPEPANARVFVDGELLGEGAQSVERRVLIGDQLRVSVQADGYEDASVSVAASEWYPWPGLFALVPLLGIPIAVPITILGLPLLGAGLIVGPLVAVGWAVVTSPTIAGLAFTRKYPDTVKIKLTKRRPGGDVLLPADLFGLPDDGSPNPLPDLGPPPPAETATKKKPQPSGGNPVP